MSGCLKRQKCGLTLTLCAQVQSKNVLFFSLFNLLTTTQEGRLDRQEGAAAWSSISKTSAALYLWHAYFASFQLRFYSLESRPIHISYICFCDYYGITISFIWVGIIFNPLTPSDNFNNPMVSDSSVIYRLALSMFSFHIWELFLNVILVLQFNSP